MYYTVFLSIHELQCRNIRVTKFFLEKETVSFSKYSIGYVILFS